MKDETRWLSPTAEVDFPKAGALGPATLQSALISVGRDGANSARNRTLHMTPAGDIRDWTIATGAAAMTFEEAMNYALTLPGTESSTSYRRPCVKANDNGFLFVGHEPQESFALHMDMATKQIVLETHPGTFFETAHYSGYPTVLVRYDGPDGDLVREMIRRAADWARAKPRPQPRKAR